MTCAQPQPSALEPCEADDASIARGIAALNDRFRTTLGRDPATPGKIVVTQGVAAQGDAFINAALTAAAAFDAFDAEGDPNGEREFGVLAVAGVTVWFKIDTYDLDYRYGSEDPADPARTRRVLTLLLPDEY
jgi:hypothetical protein